MAFQFQLGNAKLLVDIWYDLTILIQFGHSKNKLIVINVQFEKLLYFHEISVYLTFYAIPLDSSLLPDGEVDGALF